MISCAMFSISYFDLGREETSKIYCLLKHSLCLYFLESLVEEQPSHKQIALLLEESNPLTFILNANFLVNVKVVSCKY